MTIDPETLMAHADGQLDPIEARRVEQAIAADPALAEQVERHRVLAASLRDAFASVERAPVPANVETLLRESSKVVPLTRRSPRNERPFWIGAVAASLIAGLFAAPLVMPRSDLAIENGRTLARGDIARALDTQLASTQTDATTVRIGVTFRDKAQRLCRSFERGATGGIACASGKDWQVERLYGGMAARGAEYRQAGSPAAELMADAQAMMAGEPLHAAAEAAVIGERSR
ncbi:anti-sigma factor [Sphingomonas sp. IW22]|uniref:anti-sigma factor family protein n=1 Tax=Sphingomonas sp. IW22 TaxID=3242489 RepID=UPI0035214592